MSKRKTSAREYIGEKENRGYPTMSKRKTGARGFPAACIAAIILITPSIIFLASCAPSGENSTAGIPAGYGDGGDLYLFDYSRIKIHPTSSVDVRICNCNIYQDLYGDLVILGEVCNNSSVTKTDMETTYSFQDRTGREVYSASEKTFADYLRMDAKMPFVYYFEEKDRYIDISSVKIGINYKNYNPVFDGNPVVLSENYYYSGGSLIIEGKVINLGEKRIKNLELYCTFYDKKDRVVFVKKCYLKRERMMPEEQQEFALEIVPDAYLKEFDRYHFEVFFQDEIEVPA